MDTIKGTQITFRLFEAADLLEFRSWFADAELARRLSYPTDEWFDYVKGPAVRCWAALDATGQMIAELQIDQDCNRSGYFDIAIKPPLRRQGLGTKVLKAFIDGPGRIYTTLEAAVEPGNIASLACLRRCGFDEHLHPDEDGFMRFTKRL